MSPGLGTRWLGAVDVCCILEESLLLLCGGNWTRGKVDPGEQLGGDFCGPAENPCWLVAALSNAVAASPVGLFMFKIR